MLFSWLTVNPRGEISTTVSLFGLTFQRKQPSEELRAYSVAFHAINVKFHTPFIAEDTHFKAQVLRLSSRKHYPPDLMSETQRRTKGKHTERIPAAAAKLLPRRNPAQLRGAPLCLYLKTQRSGHEWRHSAPAWKHRQTQERCSSRP